MADKAQSADEPIVPGNAVVARNDLSLLGISSTIVQRGTAGVVTGYFTEGQPSDTVWVRFDGIPHQLVVVITQLVRKEES